MKGRLTMPKGGANQTETVKSSHMRISRHRLLPKPAFRLGACLLVLVLASACQAARGAHQAEFPTADLPDWQYADLRQIDPADASSASADILAVYLRAGAGSRQTGRLEIRLDLLDYQLSQPASWLIALDHAPGGKQRLPNGLPAGRAWDSLLVISAHGAAGSAITLLDAELKPRSAAAVRVLRSLSHQQIEVSLNLSALPALRTGLWVQAFTTTGEPLHGAILDETRPAALQAQPPPPAPVLLVFWDAFPAFTPAQALRRWDGAHTGPQGGRHGLYNLLRAARNHAVPITLLDLSAPESLSALDYAAGLNLVRDLARDRLLALPVWQPSILQSGKPVCQPHPANLVATDEEIPLISATSTELSRLLESIQPLPVDQINEHGLSLPLRGLLASTGAHTQPAWVVLGGSLPGSPWGIPSMARAAMAEIHARPWIRPIAVQELSQVLNQSPSLPRTRLPAPHTLATAASQACSALYAPLHPSAPALNELRSRYLSQINVLQLAADWSMSPYSLSDCSRDMDGDTLPECILASSHVFAVIQTQAAALSYLFVLDGTDAHQLVAPSSQFVVGQSPPERWRLGEGQEGLLSDPAVFAGSFYQPGLCTAHTGAEQITFTCESASLRYTLTRQGLAIHAAPAASAAQSAWQLALAFDPWQRFYRDWGSRFTRQQTEQSLQLSYSTGSALRLSANQPFQVEGFDATRQMMGNPENPNAEFPGGHYLPFPMVVVKFSPLGELHLQLELETLLSSGL